MVKGAAMIYVATWGDLVKIGSSRDPEARVRQLPYGSAQTPRYAGFPVLIGWVNGDLGVERLLHAALSPYQAIGEWYHASALPVALLVEEARALRPCNRPPLQAWNKGQR
jgi:hypothetical protein